jgi:glycosyltransferase involved in cell wall biosynthesis
MKIAINATFLNENPTGVGVFTREVAKHLCRLHSNTLVFSPVLLKEIDSVNTRRVPASICGSIKTLNNIKRFIYCNTILPLILKKDNADVLFCPIVEFPFFTFFPLVVTVHDLHPVYFPDQFGLAAKHFAVSIRYLVKTSSMITVHSQFVKEELISSYNFSHDRIHVVYCGYDKATFGPRQEQTKLEALMRFDVRRPYILFVGSLFPYKNAQTLIKAFLETKDRFPHHLVIIGRRDVAQETFPEDPRIHYLDYVPHEVLPSFYSSAEMLIQPSLAEGFGLTVLEAMACGCPVIASKAGSLPEVVGDAGLLFMPTNYESLGSLMLTLIENRSLREELIHKGFKNIQRFSWEKTAEGILEACRRSIKV